jgi:hypothetical protein
MYLMEKRHNNQEAFYRVLDRVLQEYDNLSKGKNI